MLYRYRKSRKGYMATVLILSFIIMVMAKWSESPVMEHRPVSREDVLRIASLHHKDPKLIGKIISQESGWDQFAVSSKGAVGLMQVIPASASMVGLPYSKEDLFDIEKNIEAGCRLLKYYQARTRTLPDALRLYSGGATDYARKVLKRKA